MLVCSQMHFALPPRKSAGQPPYARVRNASIQPNRSMRYAGYLVLSILTIYMLYCYLPFDTSLESDGAISPEVDVVIVTVLDEPKMSEDYMRMIKTNREDYAARHGYKNFFTNVSTYQHMTNPSPSSWSMIPAMRHALTIHPKCHYLWYLSPHALITNSSASLYDHIFARLPSLMLKDTPVVPPDSVIHTFSHLKPSQAYLILTQDMDNLAHTSFLLRNTETISTKSDEPKEQWAQFLLDTWFDPLYRQYAFQKAENHALEHIVQWHPTILAKLVIIEQRVLNSYNFETGKRIDPQTKKELVHDGKWQQGDLLVNLKGCEEINERECGKEMRFYYEQWQKSIKLLDGETVD